MRTLRIVGESDDDFRARAERAGRIARVLVDACLANHWMQQYIADRSLPYTPESVRASPTVRVEYEEAIAIGDLGSCLSATKSKHWGAGPWLMPLEPDDFFFPDRITYIYRENSVYNRRFEQRQRLKELLGRQNRPLVETAKRHTKAIFLQFLTDCQTAAIRRILGVEPGRFWKACKGTAFLDLPPRLVQLELAFGDEDCGVDAQADDCDEQGRRAAEASRVDSAGP